MKENKQKELFEIEKEKIEAILGKKRMRYINSSLHLLDVNSEFILQFSISSYTKT